MKKDVIYIDVEDDITAIIGKVKNSAEKVVALVPPKRIGVLQSAVNLRLLARAAETAGKRLVLITGSAPLVGLAASAKIPVAKNLQSKPEIAQIAALEIDDGEDVIDGAELPVGELQRTADLPADTPEEPKEPAADEKPATPAAKAKKPGAKVPDFNSFRKKLVLFGGLGVLLIGFLVWAIFFAPRATIVIAATTTDSSVSGRVTAGTGETTSFEAKTLRTVAQETKKAATVEFDATGREERGDKATGTMTLSRPLDSDSVDVPAGTGFSSGSLTFVTSESVTVPGARLVGGVAQPRTVEVGVTAANIGQEYNLSARSYSSPVNGVTARGSQMTGGSKEEVRIVTAADVQTAKEKLVAQDNSAVKKELSAKFGAGVRVIDSSFIASPAEPKSVPDIGGEAENGKAQLTSEVTYRMSGVAESELDNYLRQALESKITNKDEQRVYDTGAKAAQLTEYQAGEGSGSVAVRSTGRIGPKIDEANVKESARGKQYGAVQQSLESVDGVSSVDVKFWPFWVRSVPSNPERITVEFNLESNGG